VSDSWREGNPLVSLAPMTYLNDGGLVDRRASFGAPPTRGARSLSLGAAAFLLAILLAPSAQAQGEVPAKSEVRGAWTTHTFPLGANPPKGQAFLERDGKRVQLLVDGSEGRLRTRRYLPPGRYGLVVGNKTLRVRVGNPSEVSGATERLEAWYVGARETFRELSATLERRGSFHLQLRETEREPHLGAFRGSFLSESWDPALMSARMDLAMFRRRVVLPPHPKALIALEALAEALTKRREAWQKCLLGATPGPKPGPNRAVEEQAEALWKALAHSGDLANWRAGPLGTPSPAAKAGQAYTDPIGYTLTLPPGAEPAPISDPVDRLILRVSGTLVVVRVLEYPGVAEISELQERLARDAFERWTSYKELSLSEEPAGLRLEFAARLAFRSDRAGQRGHARVLQWARLPEGGQRAFLLIALRPEGKPLPASVQALFSPSAFQVKGVK
jgi:hypothetical protein